MLTWLKNLLSRRSPAPSRPKPRPSARPRLVEDASADRAAGADGDAGDKPRLVNKPALTNLDLAAQRREGLPPEERALLEGLTARLERGEFDLPHMPATSMALLSLAGKANAEVPRLVELISSDPSLASELLRTANSVLYGGQVPAQTLEQAVMRIGLRGLRSLIFTVSVKGTVMRLGKLQRFSEEIWRQAFSVASIARRIAPILGEDREHAFLIGLLHDVGKIALLAMLAKELAPDADVSPHTVGRMFYAHHERAGAALAAKWRLSDELASIAGCHHRFAENEAFGRGAAMASLAHKLDLCLGLDDPEELQALAWSEELEFLQVPQERRRKLLDEARAAYQESLRESARAAA
ncbi:MAG: HDOD domain-containing protein [Planctomycetes bacterium]|nr:HDOD domain-containing protein [Planctomycetota bacterium]